jgi:ribosome modulation factor
MSETMPPPVGPRGLAVRCAIQGRDAFTAGKPVLACPYGAARPFSRRAWVAGWAGAARAAGAPMPTLEELEDVDETPAPWPGDTP